MNNFVAPKFQILLMLSLWCCHFLQGQNVDWLVQAEIIGQASALPNGNNVTTDNNGNVFMSSYVTDEIQFGSFTTTGSEVVPGVYLNAAYLSKLSPTGEVLWIETFRGNGFLIINDIKADDQGNIYLLGYIDGQVQIGTISANGTAPNQNVFLAKLNGNGEAQWVDTGSNQSGYNGSIGKTLEVDSEGNLIVHAMSAGNTQYIASYSSDGILSWVRDYAGALDAQIALDAANNIYWVGLSRNNYFYEFRHHL